MTGHTPDQPRRPRFERAVLPLAVIVALMAATRADAQFILYHSTYGDWAVTCSRDPPTARVSCILAAPLPKATIERPRATVAIDESAGAGPMLSFRVLEDIDSNRPVLLLVGTAAPVTAEVNRFGEGRWQGAPARSLIDAMRRGQRLSLVWRTESSRAPRTADFALGAFDAALEDYRRRLAAFGIAAAR